MWIILTKGSLPLALPAVRTLAERCNKNNNKRFADPSGGSKQGSNGELLQRSGTPLLQRPSTELLQPTFTCYRRLHVYQGLPDAPSACHCNAPAAISTQMDSVGKTPARTTDNPKEISGSQSTPTGRTIIKPAWLTAGRTHGNGTEVSAEKKSEKEAAVVVDLETEADAAAEVLEGNRLPSPSNKSSDQVESPGGPDPKTERRAQKRRKCSTPAAKKIRKDSKMPERGENQLTPDVNMESPNSNSRGGNDFLQEIKAYLDRQFASLKEEIRSDVSGVTNSVGRLTDQVEKNKNSIEDLNKRMEARITAAVSKEMTEVRKEMGRIGALQTVQNQAPSTSKNKDDGNHRRGDQSYWRARRSMRLWPITGKDVWGGVGDFFHDTLLIPGSDLDQEGIEDVRRVCTGRKKSSKIRDEVLVTFKDVQTRDMVYSYAPNLANYRDDPTPPGIRLEIPEQLSGVFKVLERYGANLRQRSGPNLKRSIKFDDVSMSMQLDVLFPGDKTWTRIPYHVALEEDQRTQAELGKSARERLSSLSSSSSLADQGALTVISRSNSTNTDNERTSATNGPINSATLQKFNKPGPRPRWTERT